MLWQRRKKERERRMNMISAVKPTSKATLKMQCLIICKGDVDEAKKLYDFYADGMESLPDYDAIPPTWMESAKGNALGLYQFIKENRDDIAQGLDFIKSMFSKKGNVGKDVIVNSLPPINQE